MTQVNDRARKPSAEDASAGVVVVKKYANRRLYDTESSSYITLDNLADMVRAGRDFVVYDARSGEDITRGVLTQIIVEEENKGSALLPTTFLRQLIGFYGGNMQGLVPRYLEQTMAAFARQQEQVRDAVQSTFGTMLPPGLDELRRQNMAMMERAMSLFTPFYRPPGTEDAPPDSSHPDSSHPGASHPGASPAGAEPCSPEIMALRQEVHALRIALERAVERGGEKNSRESASNPEERE